MTAALQAGPAVAAPPGHARRGQVRRSWRRWRAGLLIGLMIALAGVGIGLLPRQPSNTYLSPGSTSAAGTRALADVLTGLGRRVTLVTTVPAAVADARAGSTLVITSPDYLAGSQLAALAAVRADILLVEPDSRSLAAVAPGVTISATGQPVGVTAPACALPAAVLAGQADLGGTAMNVAAGTPSARQCYPTPAGPALVQLTTGGRLVTVLGTGAPLSNGSLAAQGNAALAINVLATRQVVWLVPPVAVVTSTAAGPRSFTSLVPLAAWLVAFQLALALLLAAGWRARRLGPLVPEPLPVVVRASETVEGHGRLYQARGARARAAQVLREAALARIGPAAGLPARAGQAAVVAALAPRSARDAARVSELLYGQPPGTDRALVELARDLAEFEREVGNS